MEGGRPESRYEEKKRERDDPVVVDSPQSDLTRSESDSDSPNPKRARVDSDLNSSEEVMRIQENLFNILDDSAEYVADRDPAIQGLDSVIRSFEEEILVSAGQPEDLQLGSDLVVSHAELGFLLEASDDELGLPPSFRSSEDELTGGTAEPPPPPPYSGKFVFGDSLPQLPNYDSFESGICGQLDLSSSRDSDGINTEFVALGGLFDNAFAVDSSDESGYMPEFLFRPESLPAV